MVGRVICDTSIAATWLLGDEQDAIAERLLRVAGKMLRFYTLRNSAVSKSQKTNALRDIFDDFSEAYSWRFHASGFPVSEIKGSFFHSLTGK